MKLTFIKEREENRLYYRHDSELTLRTDAECIPDILEEFGNFLRGCGFMFDGTIEIVAEEEVVNDKDQE